MTQWSPFQNAIFDHMADASNGSLEINAVAGSGKTTTLCEGINRAPDRTQIMLAFNRRIVDELRSRINETPTRQILTTNSLGHRAWSRFTRTRLEISSRKLSDICKELFPKVQWQDRQLITKLAAGAKTFGLIPNGCRMQSQTFPILQDTEESWDLIADHYELDLDYLFEARTILNRSIELAFEGIVDFDDQLYMSTLWNSCSFQRYDLAIIDEAQDLNGIQHRMLAKLVGGDGRVVAAGDPYQAIYGFRGALPNSMGKLADRFDMTSLPLSISYRCPQEIVHAAKTFVPHIEASASAPVGTVQTIFYSGLESAGITSAKRGVILCRNNAPLIEWAWRLFDANIPAVIAGRDLKSSFTKLLEKLTIKPGTLNDPVVLDQTQLLNRLARWEAEEISQHPRRRHSIQDRADSLRRIIRRTPDSTETKAMIHRLFSVETANLVLSTIHRSKGLEWPHVWIISPDLLPPDASSVDSQESNLHYVGITRAQDTLTYIIEE